MAGGIGITTGMNKFSIRDIENLTGIKAHTIRIWEQRYGILQPKRTPTNIRYYDAEDLKLALRIALLNNYGFKISNIHRMTTSDMSVLIDRITDKEFRLTMLVNNMLEATLAGDVDRFEGYLNDYIRRNGIEQTVEKLVFLFLEKIGLMWMTDRIFPAQEHLVSNVIYRKIAVAIEGLPPVRPDSAPSVLLFLPEGEIHDIGLLFVHYLLRRHGKYPVYLGPNTPLKDAQFVYESRHPQYVYVHLTSVAEDFEAGKYLARAVATFKDANVLVSGAMLKHRKIEPSERLHLLHSLQEVKNYILYI